MTRKNAALLVLACSAAIAGALGQQFIVADAIGSRNAAPAAPSYHVDGEAFAAVVSCREFDSPTMHPACLVEAEASKPPVAPTAAAADEAQSPASMVPHLVAFADRGAATIRPADVDAALDLDLLQPAAGPESGAEVATRVDTRASAAPKESSVKPSHFGKGAFIVVGSYRVPENAAKQAKKFAAWSPTIMRAQVHGKLYRRVAIGPFARDGLTDVLRQVRQAGVSDAWPLTASPELFFLLDRQVDRQG